MHLAFVIHSLGSGGAERVTTNLANYWVERGWRITIITLAGREQDFYALHPGVRRVALALAGESRGMAGGVVQNVKRIRALRRVLRAERPDVALALMTTANVLLAWAAAGLRLRRCGSERVHPPQLPLGRGWESLRRVSYGRLDAVTALTAKSATWIRAHTRARRVSVIPNAVPWPLPEQAQFLLPTNFLPDARRVVLAVGRLTPQKGFDVLIATFAELAGSFPDWDLVIIGEGEQRPALEQAVALTGLRGRVHLPGRAGNLATWYARADLYVMTSRFEGFPNSLAEAMAHGLPAVSFDCDTGPGDIIRHEVDGLLVPAQDTAALNEALGRLMGDAMLRTRLAARAIEVRERFSLNRIAALWEELFGDSA